MQSESTTQALHTALDLRFVEKRRHRTEKVEEDNSD